MDQFNVRKRRVLGFKEFDKKSDLSSDAKNIKKGESAFTKQAMPGEADAKKTPETIDDKAKLEKGKHDVVKSNMSGPDNTKAGREDLSESVDNEVFPKWVTPEFLDDKDHEDLKSVYRLIKKGKKNEAYKLASRLDTMVRDEIPPQIWKSIGGKLTPFGEAELKRQKNSEDDSAKLESVNMSLDEYKLKVLASSQDKNILDDLIKYEDMISYFQKGISPAEAAKKLNESKSNIAESVNTEDLPKKGMWVDVYRSARDGDASLNGISSKFDELLLVGPGVPELFEADNEDQVVYLDKIMDHVIARPLKPGGKDRGMFGGNFIYTSDSRFRELTKRGGPIHIHDRFER